MSRIFNSLRSISAPCQDHQWIRIRNAISCNDMEGLERILYESKSDVNLAVPTPFNQLLPDYEKRQKLEVYAESDRLVVNVLHIAILMNNDAAVEVVMKFGPDLTASINGWTTPAGRLSRSDHFICTPAHLIAVLGHEAALNALLPHMESEMLNCRDRFGLTPLDQALFNRFLKCAELMVQSGASIAKDVNNASLLDVCHLIEKSCRVNNDLSLLNLVLDVGYSSGGSVLYSFMTNMDVSDNYEQFMQVFDKIILRPDFTAKHACGRERSNYLHLAAELNSVRILRKLSAVINVEINLCGQNPLHLAVKNRSNTAKTILYLVSELNCDMDQVDASGATPLLSAIEYSNSEGIMQLLQLGAKCQTLSQGYTYLHVYCKSGGTDARVLKHLAHQCDVNAVTSFHWTALHLLVFVCDPADQLRVVQAIDCLLDLGADPMVQNSGGDTILSIAILFGLNQIVEAILDRVDSRIPKLIVNTSDKMVFSPLFISIFNPSIGLKTIFRLLSLGANVNWCDALGRSILYYIFELLPDDFGSVIPDLKIRLSNRNERDIVFAHFREILIRKNIFTSTPFVHFSTKYNHIERMTLILNSILNHASIDLNRPPAPGTSVPITLAFASGKFDLVKMLIRNFADIKLLDLSSIPIRPGILEVCKLLDEYGFENFDPIIMRLRMLESDKYCMATMPTFLKREIDDLDRYLESRLKLVAPLTQMTAILVRNHYDREVLHQLLADNENEIRKHIFGKN